MHETKISSKGQLVIPKYIRDALGLGAGSDVLISLQDKRIIILPKPANALDALEERGQRLSLKNARRKLKGE